MGKNQARNITQNVIKLLYGLSGNMCANPCCKKTLCNGSNNYGEIAHICAVSPDGPRYDLTMNDDERRSIENLILLCESCNKLVDNKKNVDKYPVELLKKWKKEHETFTASDPYANFWKSLSEKINNLEIQKLKVKCDECYHSTIRILQNVDGIKSLKDVNIFSKYLLDLIKEKEWRDFPNIFLEGIGGIGKSTEMKIAFNDLLNIFSNSNFEGYDEFQFCPMPYFFELKDFQFDFFKKANEQDNFILFLDGLDEVSNVVEFQKYINNLTSQFKNIRFIIAGRPASFANLTNLQGCKEFISLKLTHEFSEKENEKFIQKYQGKIIFDLINIPFYRNLLETNDIDKYKDFFDILLNEVLKKDVDRHDFAQNISKHDNSSVNIKDFESKLSNFCYKMFKNCKRRFSESELRENLGEFFNFFINSSFVLYINENYISFASNIFFEYFLALHYVKAGVSSVKKEFFLPSGRLNAKFINIVGILLVLLDKNSKMYSCMTKQLKKNSSEFILLTDYVLLSGEERWRYYKAIYEEFNDKKEHILYFNNERQKRGILSNINSLSDAMQQLLPESKKDEALNLLIDNVEKFIKNPKETDMICFANSVILLGTYGINIWSEACQQERLKEISLPLIRIFNDEMVKKGLGGLLSKDVVFSWYETYGWVSSWGIDKFVEFAKSAGMGELCGGDDFYEISDDDDFYTKLKFFMTFHENPVIAKLATNLALYAFEHKSFNTDDIVSVSRATDVVKIDDDYKPKVLSPNPDLIVFPYVLEKIIKCDDVVKILHAVFNSKMVTTNSQFQKLYEVLIDKFFKFSSSFAKDDEMVFEILRIAPNLHGFKFFDGLELTDDFRECAVLKFVDFLKDDNCVDSNIDRSVFAILLNLKDKKRAEELFERIETLVEPNVFKIFLPNIVNYCAILNKTHILNEKANLLYKKYFPESIKEHEQKEKAKEKFEKQYKEMLEKEGEMFQSKEKIMAEIDEINRCATSRQCEVYELSVKYIFGFLYWKKDYEPPKVFSEFVLNLVQCFRENSKYIVQEAFSSENFLWKFFTLCFRGDISQKKEFLNNNADLKKKLINSLENEVKSSIHTLTVENANKNDDVLASWLVPFVECLEYFYDGKIPEWFPKEKLFVLACSSHMEIWHMPYMRLPYVGNANCRVFGDFTWLGFSSVFDYLVEVATLDERELKGIMKQALDSYEEITQPTSKAAFISYCIANLKNEKFNDCKNKIIDIVIAESLNVIGQEFSKNDITLELEFVNELAKFWRETSGNCVDRIVEYVKFEKYDNENNNSCLDSMIDYVIRVASITQKEKIICKYKKQKQQNLKLLAKLGDTGSVVKMIQNYINGEAVADPFLSYKPIDKILGQNRPSFWLLFHYLRLFKYCLGKDAERRDILLDVAKAGITNNATKRNFWFVKWRLNKMIQKRKEKCDYFEHLLNFLDFLEQKIYG